MPLLASPLIIKAAAAPQDRDAVFVTPSFARRSILSAIARCTSGRPHTASTMAPNNKPIYVFDHVRSNSQLFNKLFAAHPQLEQVFMPMLAASLYGPDAIFRGRKHSEKTEQAFISLANASGAAETESSEAALQRMESAVVAIQQKVCR